MSGNARGKSLQVTGIGSSLKRKKKKSQKEEEEKGKLKKCIFLNDPEGEDKT